MPIRGDISKKEALQELGCELSPVLGSIMTAALIGHLDDNPAAFNRVKNCFTMTAMLPESTREPIQQMRSVSGKLITLSADPGIARRQREVLRNEFKLKNKS